MIERIRLHVAAAVFGAILFSALGAAHAGSATLRGRVTAAESVVAPKPLSVAVDAWVCAPDGKTPDPSLVIGAERGLANVVVHVDVAGAEAAAAEGEVLIDQKGCAFEPHVALLAPGQTLRVKNSDRVLHNFRTITAHNRAVNKAQIGGKEDAFVFEKPEIVRAECDVHYWMSAIVVVAPHRFVAVTDATGRFTIEGLEPGSYPVELWHERLGTKKAAVTVSDEGGLLDVVWEAQPAAAAGAPDSSTPR